MKDQKEVQAKISSENNVKPPLLKSIYSQEVKTGRIDNNVLKKLKLTKIWTVPKLATLNWCKDQVTMSLSILPLSSF